MIEQAVFWRDSAVPGALFAGGIAVEGGRMRLRGSDGRLRVLETLPATQLAGVDAGAGAAAIAGFPSLRLDLRGGRSLVVAAALGMTALTELFANLVSLLPGA
jgi:hypothetical protein